MYFKLIFIMILFLLNQSCVTFNRGNFGNEIVMFKGMKITATNRIGTLKISAGSGFERTYTWEGESRSVVMIPRKERWNGKFGIYFPGAGNHWHEHNCITRGVLEESQLNFNTIDEALKFLQHPSRKDITLYTDYGLAVTWEKVISPTCDKGGTLHVDVWQIYIGGKKPISLPGSQNDKILVKP